MILPDDYLERVYAGVLGKMIGVYLGRPVEGWTHEKIRAELGSIDGYMHDRVEPPTPLLITDDDLSGTFTFLRALPDYDNNPQITSAQIGQTWLNYLIENRTILWWGGLGKATEHTAYLRLKQGIPAPESGSMARNGAVIAQQIGAQIFIDGWAMVSPGEPDRAAELSRRAARVSHDGEAVYAAQVIAAMEAQAFVEADIEKLIDCAIGFIPQDSVVYRMIADLRDWHQAEPDWQVTRSRIADRYGYARFGGVCPAIPNHALIFLGLLYGAGDFRRSMLVVNTAGWDTDCNAGNLGCLLGIRSGLAAFEGDLDWRGPLADRLYLPSADGGRAITDAVTESIHIANIARAWAGHPPLRPKGGARFHFELPGSLQGMQALSGGVRLENHAGQSQAGARCLAIHYPAGPGAIAAPTFILPEERQMPGYPLVACPAIYPGQRLRAGLKTGQPVRAGLILDYYGPEEDLRRLSGPATDLAAWQHRELSWKIPSLPGPIARVGLQWEGRAGTMYLDYLDWEGTPDIVISRPEGGHAADSGQAIWRRAWVEGVDQWDWRAPEAFSLAQNSGRGLLIQGSREWTDYSVRAELRSPLMSAGGIGIRVQGMRRYYALLLCQGGWLRLVKVLDGERVLAAVPFEWQVERLYELELRARGDWLQARAAGKVQFEVQDSERPLTGGAAAFVLEEGHLAADWMEIS